MLNSIDYFLFQCLLQNWGHTLSGFTSCLLSHCVRRNLVVKPQIPSHGLWYTWQREFFPNLSTTKKSGNTTWISVGINFYSRIASKVVLTYVEPYFDLLDRCAATETVTDRVWPYWYQAVIVTIHRRVVLRSS